MTRGERMRLSRRKAHVRIKELSARSGVSVKTIYALEGGYNDGNINTIELLADALGLSLDEYTGHEVKRHG